MNDRAPYSTPENNPQINHLADHSKLFFDMSPIMLCIVSSEGKFLDLNSAWESVLGYTKNEMVGKLFMDFVYSEDIEETLKTFSRNVKGEEVISFINRYCCKDGSVRWLNWHARTSDDLKTVYASANDITELKKTENALRISEENHRNLFNELPLPSFIFDMETLEILEVNPQAVVTYGYTLEEFLKLKLTDFWTDEDMNKYLKFVKSLQGESFVNREVRHKKKNGDIIDVQVSAHELLFNGRKARHVIMNDFTKEKIIMNLLQNSEEKLRKLNADKDKFFSIIAHDLRGPLGSFKQMTELMTDSTVDFTESEILHFLELMKTSSSNLYSMLENLLDWSLIQRDLKSAKLVAFEILPAIKVYLDIAKESAAKKHIKFVYNIPDGLQVRADVKMFATIIRNLFSNAVKFTGENGVITISAAKHNDDKVEITVEDSGIGMPEDMAKNLFTKDADIIRDGTAKEHGTGLGLILCKEFSDMIGAQLSVESREGKGTKFTLLLSTAN